jgi:hypothetical protein
MFRQENLVSGKFPYLLLRRTVSRATCKDSIGGVVTGDSSQQAAGEYVVFLSARSRELF